MLGRTPTETIGFGGMGTMTRKLKELIERAEAWPEEAQAELIELGLEIEAEQRGVYHASPEEIEAIDQALGEVQRRGDVRQASRGTLTAK
jgi:hypothetical protein